MSRTLNRVPTWASRYTNSQIGFSVSRSGDTTFVGGGEVIFNVLQWGDANNWVGGTIGDDGRNALLEPTGTDILVGFFDGNRSFEVGSVGIAEGTTLFITGLSGEGSLVQRAGVNTKAFSI